MSDRINAELVGIQKYRFAQAWMRDPNLSAAAALRVADTYPDAFKGWLLAQQVHLSDNEAETTSVDVLQQKLALVQQELHQAQEKVRIATDSVQVLQQSLAEEQAVLEMSAIAGAIAFGVSEIQRDALRSIVTGRECADFGARLSDTKMAELAHKALHKGAEGLGVVAVPVTQIGPKLISDLRCLVTKSGDVGPVFDDPKFWTGPESLLAHVTDLYRRHAAPAKAVQA